MYLSFLLREHPVMDETNSYFWMLQIAPVLFILFFLSACMLGVTQKRDGVCYRKRTDGFFVSFLILLLERLNNART